jgi:hypothetical protein
MEELLRAIGKSDVSGANARITAFVMPTAGL